MDSLICLRTESNINDTVGEKPCDTHAIQTFYLFKASTTIIKASTELSIHRRWRRKPPRFTIGEKYLFESGTFICWHFYEGRKSKDNETGYLCSFDLWPTVYTYVTAEPKQQACHELFWLGIYPDEIYSWIFIYYYCLSACKTRNYQNSVSFIHSKNIQFLADSTRNFVMALALKSFSF